MLTLGRDLTLAVGDASSGFLGEVRSAVGGFGSSGALPVGRCWYWDHNIITVFIQ